MDMDKVDNELTELAQRYHLRDAYRKLERAKLQGNQDKVEFYSLIVNRRLAIISDNIFKLKQVLDASKNVIAHFKRGDDYYTLTYDDKTYPVKLKFNGVAEKLTKDLLAVKRTKQYRNLTTLGFKSENGRTFTLEINKTWYWLSMKYSKIYKLSINRRLVDEVIIKIK